MTVDLKYPTSTSVDRAGLTPDALAILDDLDRDEFLFGLDQGWWREIRWAFPKLAFAVTAASRSGAPDEFVFEFECSRYRGQAPLCLQLEPSALTQAPRAIRPKGTGRVGVIFRLDWENGRYLYSPLDRFALTGHTDWPAKMPRSIWTPTSTITRYLFHLHGLLNSPEYSGVVGA